MFRRRQKLPLLTRIGRWIWPRTGWRRALSYMWHRLQRIPGTPSSIAAGFACGAAVAMTPFYGTHMAVGGLLALALGGNVIGAFFGAQIANPWTAAPLWFGAYYIGAWMLGINLADHPPNFIHMFKSLTEATLNLDIDMFLKQVWPIFWPMVVGSVPMAFVAGIVSYFTLTPILKSVQAQRRARVRRKREKTRDNSPPAGADA